LHPFPPFILVKICRARGGENLFEPHLNLRRVGWKKVWVSYLVKRSRSVLLPTLDFRKVNEQRSLKTFTAHVSMDVFSFAVMIVAFFSRTLPSDLHPLARRSNSPPLPPLRPIHMGFPLPETGRTIRERNKFPVKRSR